MNKKQKPSEKTSDDVVLSWKLSGPSGEVATPPAALFSKATPHIMSVLEVAVSGGCSLHPKPIPLYENRGSIVFMWGDFVSATTRQKYQATYGPIEKNDFYHQRMTREGIRAGYYWGRLRSTGNV